MLVAIPIAAVMYFFLLPARFEGERYAPTKLEKWIVIGGLGLAMLIFAFFVGGSWLGFCLGTATIYALLIPVRMMLRVKIFPLEAWLTILAICFAFLSAIVLPLLPIR